MKFINRLARRDRRNGQKRSKVDLNFEVFEDRLLLSNFTVTNTSNSGNGSLAQAIISANSAPGSTITFDIPVGPLVISPTAALPLPAITNSVTIDGTTEPGIIIDGTGLSQDGFVLGAGSNGSTIKGLTVQNFGKAGIHIQSSNDTIADLVVGSSGLGNETGIFIDGGSNVTIGGTTASAANTIGFNAQQGIQILGGANNAVEGNFIGTNAANANQGNGIGVLINNSSGNIVGGIVSGSANTIGFNTTAGIQVLTGTGNTVEGNLIGTNAAGSNLGNAIGVLIQSASNLVGGTANGSANTIAFNATGGIELLGGGASGNAIQGNFIGTDIGGHNLANQVGVLILNASNNSVGGTGAGQGNTIGFNSQQGVSVLSGVRNAVRQNLYTGTNGPATPVPANDITLGPGANNNQPAPNLVAASLAVNQQLTVQLTDAVPSGTSVDIELYQFVTTA